MGSPSKMLVETEDALREVIEGLIDSQERLQKIGEELQDETLRRYFLAESLRRAQFRGELENILHQEGVKDIKESGTAEGTFMRVWAELKARLGGRDHTLLATAEEGEDGAVRAYAEALKKDLPLPVREVLQRQAAHIESCHDYVRDARDRSKEAA